MKAAMSTSCTLLISYVRDKENGQKWVARMNLRDQHTMKSEKKKTAIHNPLNIRNAHSLQTAKK